MTVIIRRQFHLNKSRMIRFLDELRAGDRDRARTVYLPKGVSNSEVESAWRDVAGLESFAPEVTKIAAASESGSVLFVDETAEYLVIPPFPLADRDVQSGYASSD